MLLNLACLIVVLAGIYALIEGIIYYREITKEDREYAKELKEAKKRRAKEEKENRRKNLEKLEKDGFSLSSKYPKGKKITGSSKPWIRFRILITFPCILILGVLYMLAKFAMDYYGGNIF